MKNPLKVRSHSWSRSIKLQLHLSTHVRLRRLKLVPVLALSSSTSPANDHVLFSLFPPGEVFIQLLCLPLHFFFFTFICRLHGIDSQPPVCCLCEQHTSRDEGRRGRWKGPIFPSRRFARSSLEGGFPHFTPLSFLDQNKDNMWAQMQRVSVWRVGLEDAEETDSLQPTESIILAVNLTTLNGNTP